MWEMSLWLEKAFVPIEDPVLREYLQGRGVDLHKQDVLGWGNPTQTPPDTTFTKRFQRLWGGGYFIIPYRSPRGKIFGFSARNIKKDYLKYAEPQLDFLPHFVGMTEKKMQKIWERSPVCLVEGLFDLVVVERLFPDVVLGLDTAALSRLQFLFVKRFVSSVYLCLDRDAPGIGGTKKIKKVLQECSIPHSVIEYVGGKDPGEIWDRYGETQLKNKFLNV